MNFKKSTFALAIISLSTAVSHLVFAQEISQNNAPPVVTNAVTIYGVVDLGTRYSEGLGISATSSPSATNGSTSGLANGVDRSGRFGITGGEDLGGGYQALFTLEGDLYANTGSVNPNLGAGKDASATTANKLFERQATIGLVTPFGRVVLGRQQNAARDVIDDIDAIGGRFTAFNPNLQFTSLNSASLVSSAATYYGVGNAGNDSMQRQDNAIKYIKDIGPVTATLVYSFGGVSGSSAAGSSEQGALTYHDNGLVLSAAYLDLNNINDTLKLTDYTVGGRYTLGDWQIAGNYSRSTADRTTSTQIKTNVASIGTTYAATSAIDLTLGYYNVDRSWSANAKPEANIKRVIGFAEYKFSKKTLVFLEVDHNKWGGDPTQFQGAATNKASTTGLTLGIDYKI